MCRILTNLSRFLNLCQISSVHVTLRFSGDFSGMDGQWSVSDIISACGFNDS